MPVAESAEQGCRGGGLELFRGETPGELDRRPDLLQVGSAAVAGLDVRLEAGPLHGRKGVLEVVGDELHELLATQLFDGFGHASSARYSSSAARTFERARCRSTL